MAPTQYNQNIEAIEDAMLQIERVANPIWKGPYSDKLSRLSSRLWLQAKCIEKRLSTKTASDILAEVSLGSPTVSRVQLL